MRLQLSLVAALLLLGNVLIAQAVSDSLPDLDPVEINFLFNYYEQDGVHSAVTGGEGTEELTDLDGRIQVYVPLDTISTIHINGGFNQYTSASTDRIDSRISSASRVDRRAHLKLEYEKRNRKKGKAWSIWGGGSIESDYISTSFGFGWSRKSPDGNREFSLQAQAYLDTWIVIFPEELRNPGMARVDTDKRRSFSLSGTWSQVVNKRMQTALTGGLTLQQGLLSTPFHRVYFQGSTVPRIEKFPGMRLKVPLGLRVHYFLGKRVVLRFFQRAYWDSFGIFASSSSLDVPLILGRWITVSPYYRFHIQSPSRFFEPFGQHLQSSEFYTSDFDLSGFISQQYGVGLKISPISGLLRFRTGGKRRQVFLLQSLGLKWMNYRRSDGLRAMILSGDLGFRIR